MQAIDRRLVIGTVEIAGERLGAVKQAHAETLAAAVRLQDRRATGEMLNQRRDEPILAGDQHGARLGQPAIVLRAQARRMAWAGWEARWRWWPGPAAASAAPAPRRWRAKARRCFAPISTEPRRTPQPRGSALPADAPPGSGSMCV